MYLVDNNSITEDIAEGTVTTCAVAKSFCISMCLVNVKAKFRRPLSSHILVGLSGRQNQETHPVHHITHNLAKPNWLRSVNRGGRARQKSPILANLREQ